MKQVLVAGGAGFIGSHLIASLLTDGYSVQCLDNLISGSNKNVSLFASNANFSFSSVDIIDVTSLEVAAKKADFIFHLASPASPNGDSPRSYISKPIETLMANSIGTKNLLDLAKRWNARILYASTSEVYGDPAVTPQKEEYWGNVNPNGIRSVYDEAKRFGEAIVMAYVRSFSVDARIVRIFNTYGPNMQPDDGRVVSNFLMQALHNQPITIYGEGNQTRSFCYVSDMVEGLKKLMFTEGINGSVINIGNPTERTIREFATLIKEMTHSSSEIVHQGLPEDDPKQRRPDITKAKEVLGWEPVVSLEEGLAKTAAYFKQL